METPSNQPPKKVKAKPYKTIKEDIGEVTTSTKRQWTKLEDSALVECMIIMKEKLKWKADNGFKAGYYETLRKLLNEKLPEAKIQVNPHIMSRVKLLKKHYNAIRDIRINGSGFRWNDKEKCIQCDPDVFDDYVKSHPAARGLRNKPFPHYDAFEQIFGTKHASGASAEVPPDLIKTMDNDLREKLQAEKVANREEDERNVVEEVNEPDEPQTPVEFPIAPTNIDIDASATKQPTKDDCGERSVSSKRKISAIASNDSIDKLCAEINSYTEAYKEKNESFKKLVRCFEREYEEKDLKKELVKELMQFPWLNQSDIYKVAHHLIKDNAKFELYFALPTQLKEGFLKEQFSDWNLYVPSFGNVDH